jgi:hypothetical protein
MAIEGVPNAIETAQVLSRLGNARKGAAISFMFEVRYWLLADPHREAALTARV